MSRRGLFSPRSPLRHDWETHALSFTFFLDALAFGSAPLNVDVHSKLGISRDPGAIETELGGGISLEMGFILCTFLENAFELRTLLSPPFQTNILKRSFSISFLALGMTLQVYAQTDPGQVAFSLEREGKLTEAKEAWRALATQYPSKAEPLAHLPETGAGRAGREHDRPSLANPTVSGCSCPPAATRFPVRPGPV